MLNNHAIAVDAKQLAELLGLSVRTVRRLDSSAKLPRPVHIGGAVRWRLDEINAWLAADCPDRQRWEGMKSTQHAARK
jgi:excisionase family DNA binding protein